MWEMADFNEEQIEQFIQNWFLTPSRKSGRNVGKNPKQPPTQRIGLRAATADPALHRL